jgi:hypothetical protein
LEDVAPLFSKNHKGYPEMAKVSCTGVPNEFISPWGHRVSLALGATTNRKIEDVYFLEGKPNVEIEYDSPEEMQKAKELREEDTAKVLRNVPIPVEKQANATISVPDEGLFDVPVLLANPVGLFTPYSAHQRQSSIKLDPDQLRDVVIAVLQAAGVIQANLDAPKITKTTEIMGDVKVQDETVPGTNKTKNQIKKDAQLGKAAEYMGKPGAELANTLHPDTHREDFQPEGKAEKIPPKVETVDAVAKAKETEAKQEFTL